MENDYEYYMKKTSLGDYLKIALCILGPVVAFYIVIQATDAFLFKKEVSHIPAATSTNTYLTVIGAVPNTTTTRNELKIDLNKICLGHILNVEFAFPCAIHVATSTENIVK